MNVHDEELSRRRFLGAASGAAAAGLLLGAQARAEDDRLELKPGIKPSRVVQVRSSMVVEGPVVHRSVVAELIDTALQTLTGKTKTQDAWRRILKPRDIVGLKFNRSGARTIGTSAAVAEAIVASLRDAGWPRSQIVCMELPPDVEAELGTIRAVGGYDSFETDFGSGRDQLALVLRQVSAIVNIPFLKTHNLAGMTCCLKNLSHAFVKHPARYHSNGCSPFIADIAALPNIRSKLKLCLVNALRIVYEGGPEASVDTLSDDGIFVASMDPVATDAVGLMMLNDARSENKLPKMTSSASEIPYLADAHRKGLGVAVPHGIELIHG